jgi:exopolysaccharide biosynthesis predicted pyruvyltransferase EpsI
MESELLSIIIPIYNVEPYLKRCVDSIINQTYKNLEIILVDDSSPDNCGLICDEYSAFDNRISVIHKSNGGLSDARNAGLDMATGQWIGFVDSDDYCLPTMYEKLYNAAITHSADLSCATMGLFGERSFEREGNGDYYRHTDEILTSRSVLCRLSDQKRNFCVCAMNKLYRKQLFTDLRYPKGKNHEDEFVIHHIIGRCNRIVTLSEPLYMYFMNSTSIMGKKYSAKRLEGFDAIYDRYLYLNENQIMDKSMINGVLRRMGVPLITAFQNLPYKENKDALKDRYHLLFELLIKNSDFKYAIRLFLHRHMWLFKILKWGWDHINGTIRHNQRKWHRAIRNAHIKSKPLIILLESASYSNFGDVAISIAEMKFLKNYLTGYTIIEVDDCERDEFIEFYKTRGKPDDILLITGGRIIGTLWIHSEITVRNYIKLFPNNRIIIFPQSVHFSDDEAGRIELNNTRDIWQSHKSLSVCLREHKSFDFVRENLIGGFFRKAYLLPDMVLYLNKQKKAKRKYILFCLNADKEKVSSDNLVDSLSDIISQYGIATKTTSTDKKTRFLLNARTRPKKLEKKLREFRSAKLVITDRLHGMIFSAITGTPCIALNNVIEEIAEVYEWIKYLTYIKLAQEEADIPALMDELLNSNAVLKYDNNPLIPHFEKLAEFLNGYEGIHYGYK